MKWRTDRCEFRYDPTHPAYKLIRQRAAERGVSFQRVLGEAVQEWYALTQLGVRASARHDTDSDPPASEIADQWM